MGFHSKFSNSWTRVYPGSCIPHNKVEGVLDSAPKSLSFLSNYCNIEDFLSSLETLVSIPDNECNQRQIFKNVNKLLVRSFS